LLATSREAAFLDLDFQLPDRPVLVTQLLTLLGPDVTQAGDPLALTHSPLWQLSVATRLKRLLHIVRDTEGITTLPLRLRCTQPRCQQSMEIELSFADLDTLHPDGADGELLQFPSGAASPLAFRRPTGDDLRRWREQFSGHTDSAPSLVQTLLVSEPANAASVELPSDETCAAAFAEFDSLVAFQVLTTCPHCQHENTLPFDLETHALSRLALVQQRLYQENHRLASAYGWSEADILRVPRNRRQRYLAQLEAQP